MSDAVLVEMQNVSRYYGERPAIRDVSFAIRRGEVLGFLGPNGAGKTTTMQVLSGNLAPSSGRVLINGHDLLDDPRAAKAAIGYLPENPPLYRELTVDEYLDYCAALNRLPKPRRRAARDSAKARCGLKDSGRRLIGNLSKGFQQRVGIAQAIIHLPPLVILDEPTVGLDPIQIREIRHLIRELGRDHGVILSTHILPEVQATCDRVQIIHKGRLVLNDTIDGLARHLKSATLVVGFRQAPELARLQALPGVSAVQAEDGARVRLFYDPAQDPTDAVVRLAAEAGWGLHEIAPEKLSLEELFVELTANTGNTTTEAAA
jgi:ABC-2 type transport system ATP-binding protein